MCNRNSNKFNKENNVCIENWRNQSSSWMGETRWWEFTWEQTTAKPLLSGHPRGNVFFVVLIYCFFYFQPIKSLDLALLVFSRACCGSRWTGVLPTTTNRGMMERQFPIKPGQPREMTFAIFYSFPESTKVKSTEKKKGDEPVCQNGTASISVSLVRPIQVDHL